MHGVGIYHINEAKEDLPQNEHETSDGSWVVARPLGRTGLFWRIKCAWLVFRGKADLLTFTEQ